MPGKKKMMTQSEIPVKKKMMTQSEMEDFEASQKAKRLAEDTAKADAAAKSKAAAAKAESDAKAEDVAKAEAEAAAAAAAAAAAKAEDEAAAAAAAAAAASKAADVAKLAEPIKRFIEDQNFSLEFGKQVLALPFAPYSQFQKQGYERKEIPDEINIRVFAFLHIFLQMLAPIHTSVKSIADLEAIFYSVFVAWLLKQNNSDSILSWLKNNKDIKDEDLISIKPKLIYDCLPKWRKSFSKDSFPWERYPAWIFSQHITWEKMKLAMSATTGVYKNGIYQIDNRGTGFEWKCNFQSLPLYHFEESYEKKQNRFKREYCL
jgi:hypothetical protein